MKKQFLLVACLLLIFFESKAQSKDGFSQNWTFTTSYIAHNINRSGLQLSAEKVLKEKPKTKKEKEIRKQRLLLTNLGFYTENPSHTGIFNNYQYEFRRMNPKNKFWSLAIGPGLVRTIFPETYQINADEVVTKKNLAGRTYFTPTFSVGRGKMQKKGWQIKLHTMILTSYNNSFIPHFNLEFGFKFGGA